MDELDFREIIRGAILEQSNTSGDESGKNSEKKEKPKKSKKKDTKPGEIGVSVGRGAWSKQVKEAGALADSDPNALMKRLGIDKAGSDLSGVSNILKQAFANETMGQAYSGLATITKGGKKGIMTTPTAIDQRNGIKYIQHTLFGAKNSGKLSLSVPLQVGPQDDGSIIIYVSDTRNSW